MSQGLAAHTRARHSGAGGAVTRSDTLAALSGNPSVSDASGVIRVDWSGLLVLLHQWTVARLPHHRVHTLRQLLSVAPLGHLIAYCLARHGQRHSV